MKQRAFNRLALACLVLAVGIAALWVRGLYARDQLVFAAAGRKCALAVFPHHVYLIAITATPGSVSTDIRTGLKQYPSRARYWEIQYQHRPGGALRIGLPFWLPLVFAIAPPLWWLIQRMQTLRRRQTGLCRECGYDLRASRERCPECGTAIVAAERGGSHRDTEGTEAIIQDPARRYETPLRWQMSLK